MESELNPEPRARGRERESERAKEMKAIFRGAHGAVAAMNPES